MISTVALGSDAAGAGLRRELARHLRSRSVQFTDYGCDSDDVYYPSIGRRVAEAVAAGEHERAILCCGTGIGMCIVANKVPGVYAALCHDTYSAQRARKSNNAQILTLGARVIGAQLAFEVVDAWLHSEFEGGRSAPKLAQIIELEHERFR